MAVCSDVAYGLTINIRNDCPSEVRVISIHQPLFWRLAWRHLTWVSMRSGGLSGTKSTKAAATEAEKCENWSRMWL
jgi:hypothetical protein